VLARRSTGQEEAGRSTKGSHPKGRFQHCTEGQAAGEGHCCTPSDRSSSASRNPKGQAGCVTFDDSRDVPARTPDA
jgi:hypothetical protein